MATVKITFDPYYSIQEYNKFIETAKKKNIKFKEYICIKPPYNWFIEIEQGKEPTFLDFKYATSTDERYLLEKLIPIYPADDTYLKRRETNPRSEYERYVSPNIFKKIPQAKYCTIFKFSSIDQIRKISTNGIKVYYIGRYRGSYIGFSFNKYIQNFIMPSNIILAKTSDSQYSVHGEFEADFNYKFLVGSKMTNKTRELPYAMDGIYYPLNITPKTTSF